MKEKKYKYEKAMTENKSIMIDYIEEMMNIAGVEQKIVGCQSYIRTDNCDGLSCDSCDWYNTNKCYPDFTAEKQLEIIKLMCDLPYSADFKFEISKQDEDWIIVREIPIKEKETTACYAYSGRNKNFAKALAEVGFDLINAGELDKQKIKEVLE